MADAYLSQAPESQDQPNAPDAGPQDQRTPQQLADYWLDQIQFSERKRKKFTSRGKRIIKRYRNERGAAVTTTNIPIEQRRMNVLWSNVQTLHPVLYSQDPKANVSRRNKTNKDPIGRVAAQVLEYCLQNSVGMEDFSFVMNQVVDDRLLPGTGVCMVEYVPTVDDDEVGWQAAETVYIHWEDWLTNVARTWQEVTWWGYRTFHTRQQVYDLVLKATGDKKHAANVKAQIALDHSEEKSDKSGQTDGTSKATVWCVWDKTTERVLMVAPGFTEGPLADLEPPVNYDGFFPIPRPLQATTTNDSTLPVPDFEQYVDQADEIDMLTQRIGVLSKALRLRGLYPADMESIKQLMDAGDADMIPIENAAMFAERGGAESLVAWFPIEAIAKTLKYCYDARGQAIQVMYQITGISDVMRAATDPNETAAAQQLKAQFGGTRVKASQREVARFNRDILRLKAEVISEHFNQQVLQAMSGVQILTDAQKQQIQQAQAIQQQRMQQFQQQAALAQQHNMPPPPPPPQLPPIPPEVVKAMGEPTWEQVIKLLRNEKLRGFIVDVEADSTIEPDQQAQQAAAVQFVTVTTQYLEACAQIMMAPGGSQAAPLLGEMLSWATRQFHVADSIEPAIDEFVEKMVAQSQQPPPPDPKAQAEQTKAQGVQAKTQAEIGKAQIGMQTEQVKAHAEQTKAQLGVIQTVAEHHTAMAEKAADFAIAQATPNAEGSPPA